MKASVHIGTSGWHYSHWKGPFYPKGKPSTDMLRYYAEHFDSVEINNSFYRLPQPGAIETWLKQTPADFCFAVKASRYITHNRKLLDPENTVARFMEVAKSFGRKLGPILFQFPPAWKVNIERLRAFLEVLPPRHRYAFEFRNPTWHIPGVYQVLGRFNAAFCIFEINGLQSPVEVTADFVYVRLHGPRKAYQGKYSKSTMQAWAMNVRNWIQQGCAVYFYFDNDQSGFAAQNALELQNLVLHRERSLQFAS